MAANCSREAVRPKFYRRILRSRIAKWISLYKNTILYNTQNNPKYEFHIANRPKRLHC